jgi:hypothetical protein
LNKQRDAAAKEKHQFQATLKQQQQTVADMQERNETILEALSTAEEATASAESAQRRAEQHLGAVSTADLVPGMTDTELIALEAMVRRAWDRRQRAAIDQERVAMREAMCEELERERTAMGHERAAMRVAGEEAMRLAMEAVKQCEICLDHQKDIAF